ncbi:MBL fold metallo-hydrolase [Lentibacillus sp. N15]|uniref:MBL fold metallo-hydrolase n=1 Tax=Lentibacillus songyuanensis TaxID=3136161 RepID=UPI0031BB67F6
MVKTISTKELAQKIVNQENTFILDVRNTDEFDNWKIEGRNMEVLNEPYFNLLDGIDPVADKLRKDQEMIVVCAKGGSSEMIADMLRDAGFTKVFNLEGGMKAWGEYLQPVKIGDLHDGGSLYQFVRLGKGCLSYFIESNGEAAVIDASRMTDVYETFANEHDVNIKHVLDTHLHADHISGGRMLAEATGGTYYLPPKDAADVTFDYRPLVEDKDIMVGNTSIQIHPIYSPGHTIGSTSFIVDDTYLLTGDILFVRSIGRPDLAGLAEDWVDDLRDTLYSRYKNLSADLIVLPAHYSFAEELGKGGRVSARLGDLYQRNEGLRIDNEDDFRKMVTENLPPQPNAYEDIRQINMGRLNPELEEQREMESGPNRCAVEG